MMNWCQWLAQMKTHNIYRHTQYFLNYYNFPKYFIINNYRSGKLLMSNDELMSMASPNENKLVNSVVLKNIMKIVVIGMLLFYICSPSHWLFEYWNIIKQFWHIIFLSFWVWLSPSTPMHCMRHYANTWLF